MAAAGSVVVVVDAPASVLGVVADLVPEEPPWVAADADGLVLGDEGAAAVGGEVVGGGAAET